MKRPPTLRVIHFYAGATRNQAARWSYWARRAGFRSIGAWLERLADREVREREREGGYMPSDKKS